jgi:hypothetical protein
MLPPAFLIHPTRGGDVSDKVPREFRTRQGRGAGDVLVFSVSDGNEVGVEMDPRDPVFCEFLTCGREQGHGLGSFEKYGPATYCHDVDAVVECCKQRRIMLAARRAPNQPHYQLEATPTIGRFSNQIMRFEELQEAVAPESGDGIDPDGLTERPAKIRVIDGVLAELNEALKDEVDPIV